MIRNGLPFIIDIEASGFGANSYPIEIGLALDEGQRYCRLVRPCSDWVHWSEEAQGIHGIDRDMLFEKGIDVQVIAHELNHLLEGKTVFSDGWVVDEPWLIKLFEAAKVQRRFYMYDIVTILSENTIAAWDRVKAHVIKESKLTRHRASNDALIIQQTYTKASLIHPYDNL